MSKLGRKISQHKEFVENIENNTKDNNDYFPLGIKTPLKLGTKKNETLFAMNYNIKDQINDNLRNLLLTKKGERLGFPDFGTDLNQLYHDTTLSDDEISEIAMEMIKESVEKFMPNIELKNFYSGKESETLNKQKQMLNDQSNISFNNEIEISDINKNDYTEEQVYLLKIIYNIPRLNNENTLEIKIRTSR